MLIGVSVALLGCGDEDTTIAGKTEDDKAAARLVLETYPTAGDEKGSEEPPSRVECRRTGTSDFPRPVGQKAKGTYECTAKFPDGISNACEVDAATEEVGCVPTLAGPPNRSGSNETDSAHRQELTKAERAEARRLVSRSPELRRILGEGRSAVTSIGFWSRDLEKRHREALRSLTPVRVRVDPPATVRAQWPYIAELQPCERQWVPLTVRKLREVFAFVDVSRSQVAAIVPSESDGFDDWNVPARPNSPCSA